MLLDDQPDTDFDAEFAKMEEELRKQGSEDPEDPEKGEED